MKYFRLARNYIIALLLMLAVVAWGMVWLSSPMGGDSKPVLVAIPKGATAWDVSNRLKEKGLIRSGKVFVFTVKLSGKSSKLKPGAYKLSRRMSLVQIINKIESGKSEALWVTIPEGYTLRQIAGSLAAKHLVSEDAFIEAAHMGSRYPDLATGSDGSLEGYLFPDTYLVSLDASPEQIVNDMVENFKLKVLKPKADEIKACGLCRLQPGSDNLRDAVIVASLIEREAKVPGDRTKIAAVIYNRLRLGMKLDIDATVQYARGEHKSRLFFSDLAVDSPYNTYKNAGLPPGPIANPGAASIEAALNPASTDALYYVAKRDGSHVFSRTLAEHNQAIRRIRSGS